MTSTEIVPQVSRGAYELTYYEAGTGPVLVMLHGSGPGVSGMSNFADNLIPLAETFRTIVVDMPRIRRQPRGYLHPSVSRARRRVGDLLAR